MNRFSEIEVKEIDKVTIEFNDTFEKNLDKFLDYFSRNQVTLDEMKTAFYGFLCDNDRDKIEREAKANFEDIKYPKYNDSVEDILFNRTNKIDFENFDDNHKNQNKVKR